MSAQALTAEAAKPSKAKGHRALRIARRKAYYASLPARTIANKKRTLARQLRFFPEDSQARAVYIERYGEQSAVSPLTVPIARALKRAKRRKKAAKRAAVLAT